MPVKLSAKEELFCQYYIKTLNKAESARKARYSVRSAKEVGYNLFTKAHIVQRIEELRQEMREKLGIDDHSVIAELAELSFWNIKDFVTKQNEIKDLSKIPREKLKPVAGIKSTKTITRLGDIITTTITTELKMVDKRASVIDLGRHLGIFEKDNKQLATKIKVTRK